MKSKLIVIGVVVLALFTGGFFLFGTESAQKGWHDIKADLVGTHRTVEVYSEMGGNLVKTYEDKDLRFDRNPDGSLTVWRGSVNKKSQITGGIVIIDDM